MNDPGMNSYSFPPQNNDDNSEVLPDSPGETNNVYQNQSIDLSLEDQREQSGFSDNHGDVLPILSNINDSYENFSSNVLNKEIRQSAQLPTLPPDILASKESVNISKLPQLSPNGVETGSHGLGLNQVTLDDPSTKHTANISLEHQQQTKDNYIYESQNTLDLRRNLATEFKTPADYALHILFTQFVRYAERKLHLCLDQFALDDELGVVNFLSEADPTFDKIIDSLGNIAKKNPKPIIDSVMFWRKSKAEVALIASQEVDRNIELFKKERSHLNKLKEENQDTTVASVRLSDLEILVNDSKETALQADRKSLVSTFLVCRVLIDVVKKTPTKSFTGDLEEKLEDTCYSQLKSADPLLLRTSIIRTSNWNLFAELISCLSAKRFISVSDRFIADLEKYPTGYVASSEKNLSEVQLSFIIHGSRYLKLKTIPLESFEDSADFMKSFGKFFSMCQNPNLLIVYCQVLSHLLYSVSDVITAEVNHPTWVEAINLIFQKAQTLNSAASSIPWIHVIQLTTAALCSSTEAIFKDHWVSLIDDLAANLNSKTPIRNKVVIMRCICRLCWVYLYRNTESFNLTVKKIRYVHLLLQPNGQTTANSSKKNVHWLVSDDELVASVIYFFRLSSFKLLDSEMENNLLPVMHSNFFGNSIGSPMLLTTTIRCYVHVLKDSGSTERPPFPTDEVINTFESELDQTPAGRIPFKENTSAYINHEEFSHIIGELILHLDQVYGASSQKAASSDKLSHKSSASFSSLSSASSFKNAFTFMKSNTDSQKKDKEQYSLLFASVIEVIPWCFFNKVISFRKLVELLVRNASHPDVLIASEAISGLKVFMVSGKQSILLNTFTNYAFKLEDKNNHNSLNHQYLNSNEYLHYLNIYHELLESWLDSLKKRNEKKSARVEPLQSGDALHLPTEIMPLDMADTSVSKEQEVIEQLELKSIAAIIDEFEGNAMFFLCSHSIDVRTLGVKLLKLVVEFDNFFNEAPQAGSNDNEGNGHIRATSKFAAEFGTRVIQVLETIDFFELMTGNLKRNELSYPEKSRLSKLQLKSRKDTLIKLAESNYGVDSALWFRVFPSILSIFVERCPIPIAICRTYSCVRMVQLYDQLLDTINNDKDMGQSYSIIKEYKIYLMIACASLTSTSEQRMHIPRLLGSNTSENHLAMTKSHSRKKSQQMFTLQHRTITSVKSIFKMVIPLLGTNSVALKDTVVSGLSCLNVNIFTSFLESIKPYFQTFADDTVTSSITTGPENLIRIELSQILYKLTGSYLKPEFINYVYADQTILSQLLTYIKELKSFLSENTIQQSLEFQPLRSYFTGILENVYQGILQSDEDIDKWLPFEARVGCFSFLEEWSSYGRCVPISTRRYEVMQKKAAASKDAVSECANLEMEKTKLQRLVNSCMVSLCTSPITESVNEDGLSVVMSFDINSLMTWIESLCRSKDKQAHAQGKEALLNVLVMNDNLQSIIDMIIRNCYCYHESSASSEIYFTVLVQAFIQKPNFPIKLFECISLGLFGSGSENFNIRSHATKFLVESEKRFFHSSVSERFTESIRSRTRVIYKRAMFNLATYFASRYQEEHMKVISELTMIFHLVGPEQRRDVLVSLIPWVQIVKLELDPENPNYAYSNMVIQNFFEITIKFSDKIQNEVEALWIALANGSHPQNAHEIAKFIMDNSIERKNPIFVGISRQVFVYLSASSAGPDLVNQLITNLEPKCMVPQQPKTLSNPPIALDLPYVANIWKGLQFNYKVDAVFSLGQLSMIFLVDLLAISPSILRTKLALLLHASFVLLDHYLRVVQDQACVLLIHLLHELAIDNDKAKEIFTFLRQPDYSKKLWVYDNLRTNRNGTRTPRNMDKLIREVLQIFTPIFPGLQEEWSRTALKWATSCAVRHIACRSFQIFRSLLYFLDQRMLKEMLHRLSNTISDGTPDIQGFSMQILMTLNAVTAELSSETLIDFPQLFWSSVACLSTIHEQEFIEVLSSLSKFISKIDLDSEDTVNCLISTFPPKWEGKFEGLQPIIMVGLRSSNAYEPSLRLLNRLNLLKDSKILGTGDLRLLYALLANLPSFLHASTENNFPEDVINAGKVISQMADANDKPALSAIIDSLLKDKFRRKNDFLSQFCSVLRQYFLPLYEAQILVFLLGLLPNKIGWIKIEVMDLLKFIFPIVNLESSQFTGVGADLIAPLLRLLLTDYADQALSVLETNVLISGSQLDQDVLRMSLGNEHIKKEYEKTATLFGVPEPSGWAIPMPAITAATTRNNIHAVFSTCVVASNTEAELAHNNEEIQFHSEEYPPYQPIAQPTEDAYSVVNNNTGEWGLNNMLETLNNLDSFFTNDEPRTFFDGGDHKYNNSIDTKASGMETITQMESAPQVYDKKASMILNRSLARSPSNASFKSPLMDAFNQQSGHTFRKHDELNAEGTNNEENKSSVYPASEIPLNMEKSSYLLFRGSRGSVRKPFAGDSRFAGHTASEATRRQQEKIPERREQFDKTPPLGPTSSGSQISSELLQNEPTSGRVNLEETHFRFEGLLRTKRKQNRFSVNSGNVTSSNDNLHTPVLTRNSFPARSPSSGSSGGLSPVFNPATAPSNGPSGPRGRDVRSSVFGRNHRKSSPKS
ncbi:RAM signaling network component [Komagataella phaffii CBS 7435]|uniref:RAM signaling network component n=1 Tax=Komagataella phaffii (strain ATCC 76273 / CBS 7435 / CECT 11047 / NRRL Y-11430 / Wegner 21-1) TaxID=981350 RepID=F2R071_KOMPC|nr:GQ67_04427T0 [Komagataella phaffii]AOA69599.1 GQ68_04399T0 [Komagataella phaffii GS115]CAH2451311.1 RAM signaling network component [Komagataella phaffii CBS 7435]CCA41049.1 RAM signaling network component [Komagataella phaffii CBS 7435]